MDDKNAKCMEDQVADLQSQVKMLQSRLVEKNAVIEELNDSHRERIENEHQTQVEERDNSRQSYAHLKKQFDEKYLEVERLESELKTAKYGYDECIKLLKQSEEESNEWKQKYYDSPDEEYVEQRIDEYQEKAKYFEKQHRWLLIWLFAFVAIYLIFFK